MAEVSCLVKSVNSHSIEFECTSKLVWRELKVFEVQWCHIYVDA